MARIVTTHYRYKRPPRKRKAQAAPIAVPTIVTAKGKLTRRQAAEAVSNEPAQSAIVTEAAVRGASTQAPQPQPKKALISRWHWQPRAKIAVDSVPASAN
jgi:hypothetical protein